MVLTLISPQNSSHFLNTNLYLRLVCGTQAAEMILGASSEIQFVDVCSWSSIWPSVSASSSRDDFGRFFRNSICWCLFLEQHMAISFSFGQSGCCLLVPARWRCRPSIIIGVAVANSSACLYEPGLCWPHWHNYQCFLCFFLDFVASWLYHAKRWKSINIGIFPRCTHANNDVRFRIWHPWCIFWKLLVKSTCKHINIWYLE